ncbi:MAG: tyrosine-protein phosphatase [Candidatus Sericytochromatia bacterium]|nr:tyrosine-protein phosphatase [Candidatus Tanganyikabacteria bacterium]
MRGGIGFLALAAALLAGCGAGTPSLAQAPVRSYGALETRAPKIDRFAKVNDGLYRGGMPADGQFRELRKLGIRTDVSLLGAGPASQRQVVAAEREAAEAAGLRFVNVVVPYGEPSRALIDKFLQVVQDPSNQPVYVHCKHGRDRTGTMIALYRIAVDGYTGRQALAEMETFGFDRDEYPYYAKTVLNFGL